MDLCESSSCFLKNFSTEFVIVWLDKPARASPLTGDPGRWSGGRRSTPFWSRSVSSSSCPGLLSTFSTLSSILWSLSGAVRRTRKWCWWYSLPVICQPWPRSAPILSCTDFSMKTSSRAWPVWSPTSPVSNISSTTPTYVITSSRHYCCYYIFDINTFYITSLVNITFTQGRLNQEEQTRGYIVKYNGKEEIEMRNARSQVTRGFWSDKNSRKSFSRI